MPDFQAFRGRLTAALYDEARPFVEWVDKLEKHCAEQDAKINVLEHDASEQGDKAAIIKDLEEELTLLIEDILDVDRGIKTQEELIADARHRA